MENQDNDNTYQDELDSSCVEDTETASEVSSSQDRNEEPEIWDVEEIPVVSTRCFEDDQRIPGDILGMSGDQVLRQAAVSDNQLRPPQNIVNLGGNILELPFPVKLWMIVEDDTIQSVSWSNNGDSIIIEEELFQGEVLQRTDADRIFETDSLKTFIRLLHLHGFNKIGLSSSCDIPGKKRVKVYCNPNFLKDQPHLIDNIQRKSKRRATPFPDSTMAALQGKMMVSLGHLPQVHTSKSTQEVDPDVEMKVTTQGPDNAQSSMSMSNIYQSLVETYNISERCGQREESMPRNSIFESATNEKVQDLEISSSLPMSSTGNSMMALCNNSANENSDDEDEPEEGPSDYYCEL
ncbi:heat shock transcription factor, X-linked member 3-like [Sorex fumeus]|uniref:heat shock transcription factor, X-linked member 3-like n=1 Tax=Sorex fumeus TaxID=62283 RepID=UPI0024AD81A1|nr:heat shock transcription factor, X-linked member 3-like [Sorex fumeus]